MKYENNSWVRDQVAIDLIPLEALQIEYAVLVEAHDAALDLIEAQRELLRDAEEALGWLRSFYNDVMNTCPEYVDLCGDWNAAQYLTNEAELLRERIKLAVA